MTLRGRYYSCTHFADGEVESLTGFDSCQVSELTAEAELSLFPMSFSKMQNLSQGSSKQSLRVRDDRLLRSSSGLGAEHLHKPHARVCRQELRGAATRVSKPQ